MSTDLNVLIIGHGHAYWLEKFVDASGLFANFEKQGYKCNIVFLGIRGATVSSFRGCYGAYPPALATDSLGDVRWE